jgi:lipopolysaccharide transport system permease protein
MKTKPYIIIKPRKGWQLVNLKELIEYRDLFYFLVKRYLQMRYKQTVLGGLWVIIQPLLLMIVFTLFFGKLARIPSEGVPYPIFNFSAMVAWIYFANAITSSGNSLIENTSLVSKVYFPRLMLPLAPIVAGLLDLAIAFVLLIGMMLYYHIYPTIMILMIPVLVIIMILTASGAGLLLSSLNAKYRDIKVLVPLLIQIWMFVSPVVYPTSLVPEDYHVIYALNPMAGVIEGFRSTLLGTASFPTQMLVTSSLVSVMLFIIGILYFRQVERYFADVI